MYEYGEAAKGLAALGREGDSMLLHVHPDEIETLKGLGALTGKQLTINPHTGAYEAFNFLDLLPAVAGAVAAPFSGGLSLAATMAIMGAVGAASGAASSAIQGKNAGLGALVGGLGGLAGGALGSAVGGLGGAAANEAGNAASSAITEGVKTAAETGSQAAAQGVSDAAKAAITPSFDLAGTAADTAASAPAIGQNAVPAATSASQFGAENLSSIAPNLPGTAELAQSAAPTSSSGIGSLMSDESLGKLGDTLTSPRFTMPAMAAMNLSGVADQELQSKKARHAARDAMRAQNEQIQSDLGMVFGGGPRVFAEGGQIDFGGFPISYSVPDDIAQGRGLASLRDVSGLANGGYVSQQPFPIDAHPQSMIPQAQPQPGASPNRHDVIGQYNDGGLLDGPGDGMSDDIPAVVDGHQPVRLADGEYIVPADIVSALGNGSTKAGAKMLDGAMKDVRRAAHGRAQQIKQNAGALAFQRALERSQKRGKRYTG